MKSIFRSFRLSRAPSSLCAALVALMLPYGSARAQAPAIPAVYQDLYTSLNTYLVNFNTTLSAMPGSQTPTLSTGNLKNADSNAGPQLVNSGSMVGIQLQLQELKSMGVQAIMLEIGFPVPYEPFLTSQGQSYSQWIAFYQQLAANIRAAGLKLIIENDTLLTNDVQAGWDVTAFYATLDWTAYQQARAQTALTIVQTLQPDYIVVLQEPKTEADNSGQTAANTVSGSVSLLTQLLASVQGAAIPNMKVGAGTGTAQVNPSAMSFIQQFVALPLDFIDFHIYPINKGYLPIALTIASTAAAAGKPVAMTENWVWKVRDDELGVLTDDQIRGRDPFSFWAPLDAYFIQTMQNLAQHTQMLFMDPFGSTYFAAYLAYDTSTENLSDTDILNEESAQASQNMQQAIYTSTAMSYYTSVVSPRDTTPPTVPGGETGSSNAPTTAALSWSASTDNVGVAGYYILRNGAIVGTTANLYDQDSGLTSSTTYTYTTEAFDLGGNISAPSLRASVTTSDTTAPSIPGNLVATAASSQRVGLTWSPATDNTAVGSYLVFSGTVRTALTQAGRTAGTTTAYTSYPLTGGTTYYYGVEAVDTSGNASAMSAVVSVSTPTPPAAPTGVAATATSTTKIGVTWSAAASGGLPVQYYHVFQGTTASNLTQVSVVQQTSYTANTLNPATTYYFAVEAADSGSDLSSMSAVASAATMAPPAAPASLVASAVSTTRISLTWVAPSGGLPIRNYSVFRGATAANLSQVATVVQTAYSDSSVSPKTTYYYAVLATDTGGDLSPMSPAVAATTLALPSAPANLVATAISKVQVGLTWTAGQSGMPLSSYTIFRGSSPSSLTSLKVVLATPTSATDSTAAAGVTYYYEVQAKDTGGNLSPMQPLRRSSHQLGRRFLVSSHLPAHFRYTDCSKQFPGHRT